MDLQNRQMDVFGIQIQRRGRKEGIDYQFIFYSQPAGILHDTIPELSEAGLDSEHRSLEYQRRRRTRQPRSFRERRGWCLEWCG